MNTSTRNLIAVASCIVVLGGAAAALSFTGGGTSAASSAVPSTPTTDLVSKKSDDIVSMAVTNKKGSYKIIPIYSKKAASSSSASSGTDTAGTTYTIEGLNDVPIDSSAAEQVIKNGFSLVATKNLGTVSNLDEFGLKNPQATVKVSFKDGSDYNYKIGSVLPSDSSSYYMCGENSNIVYVVSVDSGILESRNYFVSKDMLKITSSSGTNDFTKLALSGKNYSQPIVIRKNGTEQMMFSPMTANVDAAKFSAITDALSTVTAASVEKAKPTAAQLKTYGLDHPAAVADFTVNKGSYKLMIGAKKDGNYYAMLDKADVIYQVPADTVSSWLRTDAFTLRDKTILMPNIVTVKAITVAQNGKSSALTLTRTKDETKSTQDKPEYTYKVTNSGGKPVAYDTSYKNFYEDLISLQLLEPAAGKPAGTPTYTLEYQYFEKSMSDKIAFYKNGDRRYTVTVNGQVYGNVTSPDVEKVVYEFRQLAG